MQIPSKVRLAMTLRQPSVLSVPLFQSSEVSFESIGRFGNERLVEITEHVRQGRPEHTTGSLEIAEDPALLRGTGKLATVAAFPTVELRKKAIAIGRCMERHDLEKEASEVSRVGTFGMPPAPTQALPLEVDQAALNDDLRP